MKSVYSFHKHKLVAVAILLLLVASSVVSAAAVLTTRALGGYLTGEAEYILQILTVLTFLIGLVMIMVGSWGNNSWIKTKGYQAVGGVVIVTVLYFIVPGIIETLSGLSTESTVFEFGSESTKKVAKVGGS